MLFVDDYHLHATKGVRRRFHRLRKHAGNPVQVFSDPWGSGCNNHGGFEVDPGSGDVVLWYSTGPSDAEGVAD